MQVIYMSHRKKWMPVIALASFLLTGAALCLLLPVLFGLPFNALFEGADAIADAAFVRSVLLFGGTLLALSISHILPYRLGYWNVAAAGEFLIAYVSVSFLQAFLPLWAAGLVALAIGLLLGCLIGILRAYTPIHEGWSGLLLSVLGIGGFEAAYWLLPSFASEAEFSPVFYLVSVALPFACALAVFIVISAKRRKKVFAFDQKRGPRRAAVWSLTLAGGLAALAAVCFYESGALSFTRIEGAVLPVAVGALAFGIGVVSAENGLIAIFISYLSSFALSLSTEGQSVGFSRAFVAVSFGLILLAAIIAFLVRHCAEAKQNKREQITFALPKREAPKIDPEDDEDGELPTISSILGGAK